MSLTISSLPHITGRLLFVDDEKIVLDMGRQMLMELGCQVQAFQSSTEALEFFQEAPDEFDLVLSDQSMPVLTGMDLAVRLHAIRPDIPIIFLSGYIDEVEVDEADKVGVREFLAKPIRIAELAAILSRYLPSVSNSDKD